ncbi:hypothetical protein Cus16_2958 [Curtobacterium sp. ER1/6]|nr:hypothetical protein Cus16_2958 [Curtobacterium sp. ER1/6]
MGAPRADGAARLQLDGAVATGVGLALLADRGLERLHEAPDRAGVLGPVLDRVALDGEEPDRGVLTTLGEPGLGERRPQLVDDGVVLRHRGGPGDGQVPALRLDGDVHVRVAGDVLHLLAAVLHEEAERPVERLVLHGQGSCVQLTVVADGREQGGAGAVDDVRDGCALVCLRVGHDAPVRRAPRCARRPAGHCPGAFRSGQCAPRRWDVPGGTGRTRWDRAYPVDQDDQGRPDRPGIAGVMGSFGRGAQGTRARPVRRRVRGSWSRRRRPAAPSASTRSRTPRAGRAAPGSRAAPPPTSP